MNEKIFPEGISFIPKKPNQPDFVRGQLWIRVDELVPFLERHKDEKGSVNIDILKSKNDKMYLALNDFKPQPKNEWS